MNIVRSLAVPVIAPLLLSMFVTPAEGGLIYSASLKNGDYGNGFIVDTFSSTSDPDGSSAGDGNLSNIGITNTPDGVDYTSSNAVINYSIGRDYGSTGQNSFRLHGTVSVLFKADLMDHVSGQPFVDNYGFNQFNSGQASFGTSMSRSNGGDSTPKTSDDKVSIGWSTWHLGVAGGWVNHVTSPVLLSYDTWHHLGFAWGGVDHDFEIWVDGTLMATHELPGGATQSWGSSGLGLGSSYNFALGEIHERSLGNTSPFGVTFADLEIWNEYRAQGATAPVASPIPEPATLALFAIGASVLAISRFRRARRIAG